MPDSTITSLAMLEAASLIRPGESADEEYRFKHALVQETAYGGLLRERRSELHKAVAEAILRVNPEAAMYQPAVLAFHYARGGEDERAFRFAVRAGHLAGRNYAHQEAVANYDLALGIAARLASPELMPQIREAFLGKGTALEVAGRHAEAQQVHREMEAFGRRTGNAALEAEALIRLATSAVVTSERDVDVETMLARAETLARQAGDRLILAKTLWNQGLRDRFRNPLRADEFFGRALEITRSPDLAALPPESGVRETEAHILIDLMVSGLTSGRRQMAVAHGVEALAAFRELENLPMVADALAGLANLYHAGGDFETSRRFSEEGQAISARIDNPWGYTYNGWAAVRISADRGRWDQAFDDGRQLLAQAARVPFIGFRLVLNAILGRIWIDLGHPELGREHTQAMSRLWQEAGSPLEGWHSWVEGTEVLSLVSIGDLPAAETHLEALWPIAAGVVPGFQNYYYTGPAIAWYFLERGEFEAGLGCATELILRFEAEATYRFSAEMRYWRGRLHAAGSAWSDARLDYERAIELLAQTGAVAIQWPIHAALADALHALGDPGSAAQRETARRMVDSIAGGLRDPALRASFLARPEVARLNA